MTAHLSWPSFMTMTLNFESFQDQNSSHFDGILRNIIYYLPSHESDASFTSEYAVDVSFKNDCVIDLKSKAEDRPPRTLQDPHIWNEQFSIYILQRGSKFKIAE